MKNNICPYCKRSKYLYLKRTSPFVQYGCRACEKEIKLLKQQGLSMEKINTLFKMRGRINGTKIYDKRF